MLLDLAPNTIMFATFIFKFAIEVDFVVELLHGDASGPGETCAADRANRQKFAASVAESVSTDT